jgi:hypothetical protein
VIRKKESVFSHITSYIKYLDEITILVLSKSRIGKYYAFKTGEEYSREYLKNYNYKNLIVQQDVLFGEASLLSLPENIILFDLECKI